MSKEDAGRELTSAHRWVVALGVLALLLALRELGRVGMALYYAGRLPDLQMTASWTYWAVMGAGWFVVFATCGVGLLLFHRWGRWGMLTSISLYEIHLWVNHLLLDATQRARQLWPRDAVFSLLLLAVVWGGLTWPSVRRRVFGPNQASQP